MASFELRSITKLGENLIAKGIAGANIKFTRLAVGSGYLQNGHIAYEQTDLVNKVFDVPITKKKILGNGKLVIGGIFDNGTISKEFYYREIAIFAIDPDVGEVLYSYGNAGASAELIKPASEAGFITKSIDPITTVRASENFSVVIDPSGYITVESFEEHKKEIETGAVVVGKAKDSEKLGGQLPAWYMPTGAIMPFAGTTAPAGFLMCNGHLVSRIDYANLFAVCGTLYGTGNGSTTFNLPNMGGRFALGAGGGYSQGSVGGASTSTLTEQQLPSLIEPVKSHPSINAGVTVNEGNRPGWQLAMYNTSTCAYYDEMFVSFGGNQTHNNMPPYLALNYIIKT